MRYLIILILFICNVGYSQNFQQQINNLQAQIDVLETQVGFLLNAPSNPHKYYKALLKQHSTGMLEAIVIQNTLGGNVVWSEQSDGLYYGTLVGAFENAISLPYGIDGFTFMQHGGDAFPDSQDSQRFYNVAVSGSDQIQVVVVKGDGTPEDLSVRNFYILVDIFVP